MKKRILSLILALQMAATLLPTSVWAEGEDTAAAEPAISAEETVDEPETPQPAEDTETDAMPQPTETEDTEDAADTAQIPGHAAHILRYGHIVVIEHDNEVFLHPRRIV